MARRTRSPKSPLSQDFLSPSEDDDLAEALRRFLTAKNLEDHIADFLAELRSAAGVVPLT